MIRSMTGFGRARGAMGPDASADIVARSVNHRFLDLTVKVRETDNELEPVLRRVFSRHLARGKVEVTLRIKRGAGAEREVSIDEGLLEAVLARFAALSAKYPVAGRLEARDLLTIPQIFSVESGAEGFTPEEVSAVAGVAEEAAAALVGMREVEGRLVGADLAERIGFLQGKVRLLAARRDEITQAIHATLRERLQTLFPQVAFDSGRLEQEAALAADRSDIAEELQRLEGHLEQFGHLLDSANGPVGKRLDFLSQEILRELNTLGSKARDLALTREVLEMKSETEKVREQVQNVE
jgi:uncharacterized protein (TIGR00255 family)